MPRAAKPARLWLRPAERRAGRSPTPAEWVILDRGKQHRTGCGASEGREAEEALERHIAEKRAPDGALDRHPSQVLISDVISLYIDSRPPFAADADADRFAGRCDRLLEFFRHDTLDKVDPARCKRYADWREGALSATRPGGRAGGRGGARRDLEDLRAAIELHAARRLHRGLVETWLPARGEPRDRWLTRDEAAALLWACWRAREKQRRRRGEEKAGAAAEATAKLTLRHVARFVLLGLYSGSRAGAIAAASYTVASGRAYVDLDTGVFFRRKRDARETNKRQPTAPLSPRLVAHLKRWRRLDLAAAEKAKAEGREAPPSGYVVEYRGKPVASVKTGFASAVLAAGLPGVVTPHTLRHTAATWLMQNGVRQYDAARYLGMSPQTLDRVYAHSSDDHLRPVAEALTAKPPRAQRLRNETRDKAGTDRRQLPPIAVEN